MGMKRVISVILAVICLLAMAMPAMAAASYEDAFNSVVRIYVEEVVVYTDVGSGEVIMQESYYGIGSGFAVGKVGEPVKYFVTNKHVASGTTEEIVTLEGENDNGEPIAIRAIKTTIPQYYIVFTDLDNKVNANLAAVSDRCDLAVLSLNEATDVRQAAKILPFNGIEELEHRKVYAVGFPTISDQNNQNNILNDTLNSYLSDVTYTEGIVSLLKEDAVTLEGETIQHTAKISGGNSGGPLVDEQGHVVGVNKSSWVADEDYCMAVSSNELVRFLDEELIAYTTVKDHQKSETLKIVLIAAAALVVIAIIVAIVLVKNAGNKKNSRSLYCDAGSLVGRKYPLKKGKIGIGHDSSRCQIVFPTNSPGVSGLHCSIVFDGKEVKVTDENSRYGTWIDSNRLQPGVPTVMHRGQKLYLGSNKQALSLHN